MKDDARPGTYVAGCDVGSLTSKAVILASGGKIVGQGMVRSRAHPTRSGRQALDAALEDAELEADQLRYAVGTGYGRDNLPFVQAAVSEITCHARGALWLVPTARTVLDIGGQDCKAMRIDRKGRPAKFHTNDKCASGTGRFLEMMAKTLGLGVEELGQQGRESGSPLTIASTCTVWAQAEVIKHRNEGRSVEDIVAGIHIAMANRVSILVSSVGIERDVCVTGGVAKNGGVLRTLERLLGVRIKRSRRGDPQLAGAIGAALIAADRANGSA